MIDADKLISLISKARSLIELPATIIKTPSALKESVECEDFALEVGRLEVLLPLLPDEETVKVRFSELCLKRDEQNRGTLLHFTSTPESLCNQLYFELAKVLYPEASYLQMFGYLFPMLTHIWLLKTLLVKSGLGRRELGFDLIEVAIDDEEAADCLAARAEHSDVFKRVLLVGSSLFALEGIAAFDFKNHCKFHQLLMDKALPLKQSLILHNEPLAELYNTIEQLQGSGCSLHDFFLSILKHTEGSGTYFGSLDYARDEGSDAAVRLYRYYENLPIDVKDSLSECRSHTGGTFVNILGEIEKGACIETVTRLLHEILMNPANQKVLNIRPFFTKEKNDALISPYVARRKKGVSFVELDGKFNTTLLPEALVRPLYRKVFFENPDEIASYLVDFQPEQYQLILSEATIDFEDFEFCLEYILPLLNETQYLAFLRALGTNNDKFDLRSLLCCCVNIKDLRGIEVLLECVPPESRLDVVIKPEVDGESIAFHSVGQIEIFCKLLSCLPNNDRFALLLMAYGEQQALIHIAENLESLAMVLAVLEENDPLVAITILAKSLNQEGCLRLQRDQGIRACLSGCCDIFDAIISEKITQIDVSGFGFFFPPSGHAAGPDEEEDQTESLANWVIDI
jgi:hypothetical protein